MHNQSDAVKVVSYELVNEARACVLLESSIKRLHPSTFAERAGRHLEAQTNMIIKGTFIVVAGEGGRSSPERPLPLPTATGGQRAVADVTTCVKSRPSDVSCSQ